VPPEETKHGLCRNVEITCADQCNAASKACDKALRSRAWPLLRARITLTFVAPGLKRCGVFLGSALPLSLWCCGGRHCGSRDRGCHRWLHDRIWLRGDTLVRFGDTFGKFADELLYLIFLPLTERSSRVLVFEGAKTLV